MFIPVLSIVMSGKHVYQLFALPVEFVSILQTLSGHQ
jgi:hypothetical protein